MITTIVHPATLISKERLMDLGNEKSKVNSLPHIVQARDALLRHTPLDYKPTPREVMDTPFFNGTGKPDQTFTNDAAMAYHQALAWLVTKKEPYALNCMAILDAWAKANKQFKNGNAPLQAAWGTASMARAAELLKHTYPGWNKDVEKRYIAWTKVTLMPHLRGETEKHKLEWGFYNNWHTSITEARLQFALLCDDLTEANWCIKRYRQIFAAYVKDDATTGETFRDSDHCCFGLAGLVQICELAYHQGVNMYGERTRLLMKAIELHAGIYGSGLYPTGTQKEQFKICGWIQPSAWEIARNHYVIRANQSMPHTEAILKKIRPCKYALHWGWDTLTHG